MRPSSPQGRGSLQTSCVSKRRRAVLLFGKYLHSTEQRVLVERELVPSFVALPSAGSIVAAVSVTTTEADSGSAYTVQLDLAMAASVAVTLSPFVKGACLHQQPRGTLRVRYEFS